LPPFADACGDAQVRASEPVNIDETTIRVMLRFAALNRVWVHEKVKKGHRAVRVIERGANAHNSRRLRDVLADVPRQHFVDEGLISDPAALRFLTKPREHGRVNTNGNQLARLVAQRRTSDAAHALQLLRG
jgi:hypothetical protein